MAKIKILVGTTYGTSQEVAEDCAAQLKALGHDASVLRQPAYDEVVSDAPQVLLVCSATIGQGEVPENLLPLYLELNDRFPLMPNAGFALIARGDSSYENFAEGGRQVADLLRELQLRELVPPLFLDACETMDPEAEVDAWIQKLAEVL
ncbi:flavodoxin [Marinobacterium nitratireducens]|uniref:Flavodoxin n=1 Tax=Marinobacterium nitratireducens TaxID=518897 RepID=A0A917ZHR2_9GAMM|nr:flavodoxin domain-containing protein [Marinobacterium nitratireducens]GGO83018.1 flavodoxin [Marinobacterium nitratireducens]